MRLTRVAFVLAFILAFVVVERAAFAACTESSAGQRCHVSTGPCDIDTFCPEGGGLCPSGLLNPTTPCRPAPKNSCDATEFCTGTSADCPPDLVAPANTICRPATGDCDVAEVCNGTSSACPADEFQPNGHACSDSNACTIGDACQSGACIAGSPLLSGDPVHFGPALVGGDARLAMLTLTWRDTGSTSVTALNSSDPAFRVAASQRFPIMLSMASPTAMVILEFQPGSLGDQTATLTATVDPPTCAVPAIHLTGIGAPPGLIANSTSTDFALVEIGTTSAPMTLGVINLSQTDTIIQSIMVSDSTNFVVMADGLPINLVTNDSYSFAVAARPQTVGPHQANVIIHSNSTLTPMVSLSVHVEGMCTTAACASAPPPGGTGDTAGGSSPTSPLSCSAAPGGLAGAWLWIAAVLLVVRRARRPRRTAIAGS
jgi:hypothetical protein